MSVTKEDYNKALNTIKSYENKVRETIIRNYTCCKCEQKVIQPLDTSIIDPLSQENGNWDNGTVTKVSCGYGSIYDLKSFYIAICDNCLASLEKKSLIKSIKKVKKHIKLFK